MSAFGGHSTLGTSIVYAWGLDEASGDRTDLVASKVLTDNNTVVTTTAKRGAYGASFSNANKENLSGTVSFGNGDFSVSLWFQVKDNTNGNYRVIFSCGDAGVWANMSITSIYCNATGDDVYALVGNAGGNYNDVYIANIAAANNTEHDAERILIAVQR